MPHRHAGGAAVLPARRHPAVRAEKPRRPEVATPVIHLVVNPVAGGGRARARAREAHEALRRLGEVRLVESQCRGDETRLAREAHADNARALVVLGGDGALSHAARGLIEARSEVPLTMFAAGTANDFAKNLRLPSHDYGAMTELLERGRTLRMDAGTVDGVPFVNAAGFGFDAEIVSKLAKRGKRAGRLSYATAALESLRDYKGFRAAVTTNGREEFARALMLVFSNGRHFGGAFCIAPQASVVDGALDMIWIRDASTARRIVLFARAAFGAHVRCPEVGSARLSHAEVELEAPSEFEADGECHRASSTTVRIACLPRALAVVSA